jgi:hypothetical protein
VFEDVYFLYSRLRVFSIKLTQTSNQTVMVVQRTWIMSVSEDSGAVYFHQYYKAAIIHVF